MQARSLIPLLVGIVAVSQAQLPQVSLEVKSSSTFFANGATAVLNCNCTTQGTVNAINWKKDDQNLVMNQVYSISSTSMSSVLTISNFGASQEGYYACSAENNEGIISSPSIRLQKAFIEHSFFSEDSNSPKQYNIRQGEPSSLRCGNVSSQPAETLRWDRQFAQTVFRPLDPSRETVAPDGSLFLREPSLADDRKIYRCIATNSVLQGQGFGYIQISVTPHSPAASPLQVVYPPLNITVALGGPAEFDCIPGGSGAAGAIAEWEYPGSMPNFVDGRRYEAIVEHARPENAGTYTCIVGGMRYSATLSILEPPVLTSGLSPTSLKYGDTLILSCATSSSSALWWEWFFNGTRLLDQVGSTLVRHHTTLQNRGTYQCILHNHAGLSQSATTVQVNVIAPAIARSLPPTVIAFEGWPFSLQCNMSGAPPPRYSWTKVFGSASFSATEDGVLMINEVGLDHAGQYKCVGTTVLSDGTVLSSVAEDFTTLRVIDPTVLIAHSGGHFEAQVSTRAVFACAVNHSSAAVVSFQWTKDGEPVSSSSHLTLSSMEQGRGLQLVIEEVMFSDEGRYQCIVTTRVGTLVAPEVRPQSTDFSVISSPVVPSIHKVNGTSSISFEVQWSFSGDLRQVSQYIIQVQPASDVTVEYRVVLEWSVNAVTRAEVSDPTLRAYTEYNVRVSAVYRDGSFVYSEPRKVRTGIAVPLDPPRDLNATPVDTSTIELHWKAPRVPRGPIVNYIVRYRDSGSNDSFSIAMVGGDVENHKLKNLQASSGYEVQVAAATMAGVGPFSMSVNGTLLLFSVSNTAPFVKSIGFIVLVVVVVLIGCVVFSILFLLWKRHITKKDSRKYLVRNSVHFGKGATVGVEDTDVHLSEQAVASYFSRHKRAFSSSSPTTPRSQTMPHTLMGLEAGSSFGGTEHTVSTQIISTTGSGIVPRLQSPPEYIDPPDVFASERHRRSRSQSAFSGKSGDDKDYVVMHSASTSTSPSALKRDHETFNYGEDSDGSAEKATLQSSSNDGSEHDTASEYTHHSQLTGQYDMLPPNIPHGYMISSTNNGFGLQYGRSRSDGRVRTGSASGRAGNGGSYSEMRRGSGSVPGMAAQMVDERLRAQLPSEGIANYDTYV